jgi:hypothetical protein
MSEEEEAPPTSPHLSHRMKEQEQCSGGLELPTSWRREGGGAAGLEGEANLP